MDKHELARIFNEIGLLLELKGENPFKARAYYNAARTIENSDQDLFLLASEGRLNELPGFGPALVKKTDEWIRTGSVEYYENLRIEMPPGLLELLRVPGLGAKKINLIYQTLGVTNLEMLEEACNHDRLVNLPGFGVKTQAKIGAGIKFIKEHRGEFLLIDAWGEAVRLRELLANDPAVIKVEIAGSIRRFKELVKDLDLVAGSLEPEMVMKHFIELSLVSEVIAYGPTKTSVLLKNGMQADLRVVQPEEFPHALQHFTGSKEHNTALRHYAKKIGYKVNEYGLFKDDGLIRINCSNETEIYRTLGMEYIPPQLREDLGEIEAAANGGLPKLINSESIQGIFHVHTNYSDGRNSLREMVEAVISRGYGYLGITDHSKAAVYAGGLNEEAITKQFKEIDHLNEEYLDFTIFKGIEADILPSGELDYDIGTLDRFDFVIGSIHSNFRMKPEEMTARILKAMDNPLLTILGHPTGRILLERPGYQVDLEEIIKKAALNEIIIEFNANPHRLDLDWRWCRKAREYGVKIAINPDAHSIGELDLVQSGLAVAVKGWLEKRDIFNALDVNEVKKFFQRRKLNLRKI